MHHDSLRVPKLLKESSFESVKKTIECLKRLIEVEPWTDLEELIALIHQRSKIYAASAAEATPVIHVCLRIIKIAREEALKELLGENAEFEENSTNRLFASGDVKYEKVKKSALIDGILSSIEEFSLDMVSCSENVSDLSLDFIHSDELILTTGFSRAAYHFLRRAAEKKRVFKVVVCETYPDKLGHKCADLLSNAGISVILVPDSHVFALMSRVDKVIIGCRAVFPNGTIKTTVGTHSILLAARHFSIPTYVCLPQYKLSPVPLSISSSALPSFTVLPTADPSSSSADWFDSPSKLLQPNDLSLSTDILATRSPSTGPVVWMPRWEHVPPGLVSLFLTNLGSHAPSYLYALGHELFHPLDIQLAASTD
ncbi:unnamed protein product [Dicrocoelium dendriticum]|nr:unnamed protein product [Dicrocoelium dendriticum]